MIETRLITHQDLELEHGMKMQTFAADQLQEL